MKKSGEILDEIKRQKNLKSDTELAELFHVSPSTVTNWRVRNSTPFDAIVSFCEKEGINLSWLLTGQALTHYIDIDGQKVLTTLTKPGVYKVADEHRDPVLNSLSQKLEMVYKEGTIQQKGMIRGIIEELFDEVARRKRK